VTHSIRNGIIQLPRENLSEAVIFGRHLSMTNDPFELNRFVGAQAPVFDTVLAELQAGRKRTHWMWFIFPQLRGLGQSSTALFYGIGSFDEARAYYAHPLLGPRLALHPNGA
jgi:uncharacterized protein (DUF1810 family)